jgi:hypothetical protein
VSDAPHSEDLPELDELDAYDESRLIGEYNRHARERRHSYAALFLEEIRRRESAEREQRLIYLTKWVVGLTVAICVLTAAVVALTVVVVFKDDDEPAPAPVTTAR